MYLYWLLFIINYSFSFLFSFLAVHCRRFGGNNWCFWTFSLSVIWTHYLTLFSQSLRAQLATQFSLRNIKTKKNHGKVLTYIHTCNKYYTKPLHFWRCQCGHSKITQKWVKILNHNYNGVLPKYIHVWEGRWGRWNMYLMSTF